MSHVCIIYITFSLSTLSVHSFDRHISYLYVLAIVNNTLMNMGVWVSLRHGYFISIGYTPRSKIAILYGSPIFNFLRNLHIVSHSSVPVCISTESTWRFPFSTSYPALASFYFLIIAILTDVSLYFIVVLISISLWLEMVSIFSCTS